MRSWRLAGWAQAGALMRSPAADPLAAAEILRGWRRPVRVSDLSGGCYSEEEVGELPENAVGASLGCGNPTALATLSPGEVVLLDLGSGGGG